MINVLFTICMLVAKYCAQFSKTGLILDEGILTFSLIYPLTKSKNWFYLHQCLLGQGMVFLERVRGMFCWKSVVNLNPTWIFVLAGTNSAYHWIKGKNVWKKIVLYEQAYHWIKVVNIWKKEYTTMFKIFFWNKLEAISTVD